MRSRICSRYGTAAMLLAAGLLSAASLVENSAARAEAGPPAPSANEQEQSIPVPKRGWLGVKVQSIDEDTAAALGLSSAKGALVTAVMSDGPAAMAGLKTNDAILAINGQLIADGKDLARQISSQGPESAVDLRIQRADAEQTIKVKLGARPASNERASNSEPDTQSPSNNGPRLGLTLMDGESDEGVLIAEVDPTSDAAGKGLAAGAVILEVDGKAVSNAEQVIENLKSVQEKGRKAVLLLVKSGDETRSVPVRFNVIG